MGTLSAFILSVALTSLGAGASKIFEDLGSNFSERDLDCWEAPPEYRTTLPYYWSGYDYEGSPVWVVEWGKWDIRKFVEKGGAAVELLDKYMDQIVLNIIKSFDTNSTEFAKSQMVGIIDMDGFSYERVASTQTMHHILRKLAFFSQFISKYQKNAIMINTNYVVDSFVNMVRPVLGESMERFEFYGSSKAKWIKRILQNVPRDQLPEHYGGYKGFVPLQVYG